MHRFLPLSAEEVKARGWESVDIVFVTGDAYIDHPSFAMSMLGRVLENAGYKVAILSQPNWKSAAAWKTFGKPNLFFAISAGNVDSMINHYTANKKIRSSDEYSPGGKANLRPDRATTVYSQRAKEAYPGVPVVIGGVEASMRRLAHYDYWSDTVKRSILLDSKADLLVYGMGEKPLLEIAKRLSAGQDIKTITDMRSTVYSPGAADSKLPEQSILLPSYEDIKSDKLKFLEASIASLQESNPYNAKAVVQFHGERPVIQNPPALPLSTAELDSFYALPFERKPHPSYKEAIPAWEMIKDSVTAHRGCYGGCSFCSLTLHQGKIIQSRSEESILKEIAALSAAPDFTGTISDIGGPSANMYKSSCSDAAAQKNCRRYSCLHPVICKNLKFGTQPLLELMRKAKKTPRVKRALISSGVRMDIALCSPEYIAELAGSHTGGYLSVAPEHANKQVLDLMHKPEAEVFLKFQDIFLAQSRKSGKEQYLIPYFISAFPGSTLETMAELALFLKQHNYRPLQINDFIPAPMELATAMYHTGLDPATKKPIHVPKGERERRLQRALLQYFKPENRALVLQALKQISRIDLTKKLFKR